MLESFFIYVIASIIVFGGIRLLGIYVFNKEDKLFDERRNSIMLLNAMIPYPVSLCLDRDGEYRIGGQLALYGTNPDNKHKCWYFCEGKRTYYHYDLPYLDSCRMYANFVRRHKLETEEEEAIRRMIDDKNNRFHPYSVGKRLDIQDIEKIRERLPDELIKNKDIYSKRRFRSYKCQWYANHSQYYGDTKNDPYAPTFNEVKKWYEEKVENGLKNNDSSLTDNWLKCLYVVKDKKITRVNYDKEFKNCIEYVINKEELL